MFYSNYVISFATLSLMTEAERDRNKGKYPGREAGLKKRHSPPANGGECPGFGKTNGRSEELNGLADGNDPAAHVVERFSRDGEFLGILLKRRQHDLVGLPGIDREKEVRFVAEFYEHGIVVARRVRPAEQKPGPGREDVLMLFVDFDREMTGHDRRSERRGAF